jgi:SecD/SecF fusion protein
MLRFSRLKAAMIVGLCLTGFLLSLVNFIPPQRLPAWLPQPRVNLGLDLQGGSYLLLEADMNTVIKERLTSARGEVARALNKAGLHAQGVNIAGHSLNAQLSSEADAANAPAALKDVLAEVTSATPQKPFWSHSEQGSAMTLTLSDAAIADMQAKALVQSIAIVRRRIDETGVNEPVVARQGQNRILVELPGVQDPGRIKKLLGSTAKMTFRLVQQGEGSAADVETLPMLDKSTGQHSIAVRREVAVDGANLTGAQPSFDNRDHEWIVSFTLDSTGARRFADVSTKHVGEPFAIVLDGKVISAPVIREPITGGRGQISGRFTVADANDLAVLLRAGALPAPLSVVEERTVGPSLGADAIHAGMLSVAAGFIAVVGFMLAVYGRFGIFAAIALIANLGMTLTALSMLGATLTLPGIAGLLLALGMAVDANVLINERIREETKRGRTVISAIETGFRRAYGTIVDANVTTLLKMVILFAVGTGAIKGFAVTISLGILISMFTAIVLVRYMTARWLQAKRPKSLTIGTRLHFFPEHTAIPFMRARFTGLIDSAMITLASLGLVFGHGLKMGVDFSGGFVVEARTQQAADYGMLREKLSGLDLGPVQVQQFGGANDVLLRFEQQPGGPEAQSQAIDKAKETLTQIAPGAEIRRVEAVGASVGSELFHDGLVALGLAAAAMFGYIAFRFEWPFAVGAITTMILDLTKTLGFFALTGMEFNLASVAAILTIMGFSINDKVVVYDRVRENMKGEASGPTREVIDRSINQTLSRTVGTSVVLFLAIAPLALFGGPALQEFALTLLFGLVLATSSSIFIAAPLLLNISTLRRRFLARRQRPAAAIAAETR